VPEPNATPSPPEQPAAVAPVLLAAAPLKAPIGLWHVIAAALAASLVFTLGNGLIIFALLYSGRFPLGPTPPPAPVDPAFVALGEAYAPKLAASYAETWSAMADQIDAGKPIGEAVQGFAQDWTNRRNALFEANLAGPFKSLVPEGATEDQITPAQRAAYVAACRGMAKGLSP